MRIFQVVGQVCPTDKPSLEDILAIAKGIGIKEKQAREVALDIKDKCLSLID